MKNSKRVFIIFSALVALGCSGNKSGDSAKGIKVDHETYIKSFTTEMDDGCYEKIEDKEGRGEFKETIESCLAYPDLYIDDYDFNGYAYGTVRKACQLIAKKNFLKGCVKEKTYFYYMDMNGVKTSKSFDCENAGVDSLSPEHAKAEVMACRD